MMVPSLQSWGYESQETTLVPVVAYFVPASQVQMHCPLAFYQCGAMPHHQMWESTARCWQAQVPEEVPPQMQQVQQIPQVPVAQELPSQMRLEPQMPCPATEVPLDGRCSWGLERMPEQYCAPHITSTSVAEVCTASSETSAQEVDEMSPATMDWLSASTARRLRRKRAVERRAKAQKIQSKGLGVEELRLQLQQGSVQQLIGQVWALSQDKEGCRLVQNALEVAGRDTLTIARELSGHVLEAVRHPHANYVVQKVIAQVSAGGSGFIAEELRGSAVATAKHRMGCRILCRLLEFCSTNPQVDRLVDELLKEVSQLCCHSFAHHVIQSVLEHGDERHRRMITRTLIADVKMFAQHKNASYLVENALKVFCNYEDQRAIISKLDVDCLLFLAMTPYGRHVAKTVLKDPRWRLGPAMVCCCFLFT